MRLSHKILLIVALLMMTANCDNFLAEKPRANVSPDSFFKSDKEAEGAVNGLYSILARGAMYGEHGVYMYYQYGADTDGPNRIVGHFDPIQSYTITAGFEEMVPIWQDLYALVQNSNVVIDKVTDNKFLSNNGRDKALGQALFLRAFAYYSLTNIWGDVPYYRENLPVSKTQKLDRTGKTQIRQDMVKDLKEAANLLPSTYPQAEAGRATKWAVKTLLVKYDLWLKDWKGARDTAVDIINNSPYHLLKNFADIFKNNNEYNDEIIWQIVFAKDVHGVSYTDTFNPRIRDEPKNSADRAALQDSLNAHNQAFAGFGQDIPLPGIVENWPADDLRKKASIATSLYGYKLKFPYFRKLWDLDSINSPRGNHGDNFIVFRLADVYLMAAEAENELNGPANAYQYINKVRGRAFNPDQPLSGLTQDQFRKAIHNERKWELIGESHRRMDLIRWGILVKTVKNTTYRLYDPASHIKSYHRLMPIPAREIDLTPNLKQNPGYGGSQ